MNKTSKKFLFGADQPWEDAGPGITRQIMGYDNMLMMVQVKFEKGAIGPIHKHFHSQVTSVQSGEFQLTIGTEKKTLKAGDSFYVPPNTMHECICLSPGILIDAFSPMREDFLS